MKINKYFIFFTFLIIAGIVAYHFQTNSQNLQRSTLDKVNLYTRPIKSLESSIPKNKLEQVFKAGKSALQRHKSYLFQKFNEKVDAADVSTAERMMDYSFNTIDLSKHKNALTSDNILKKISSVKAIYENHNSSFNSYQLEAIDFNILVIGLVEYLTYFEHTSLQEANTFEKLKDKLLHLYDLVAPAGNRYADHGLSYFVLRSMILRLKGYPCDRSQQIINDLYVYANDLKISGHEDAPLIRSLAGKNAFYFALKCKDKENTIFPLTMIPISTSKAYLLANSYNFYKQRNDTYQTDTIGGLYHKELSRVNREAELSNFVAEHIDFKLSNTDFFTTDYFLLWIAKLKNRASFFLGLVIAAIIWALYTFREIGEWKGGRLKNIKFFLFKFFSELKSHLTGKKASVSFVLASALTTYSISNLINHFLEIVDSSIGF